MQEKSFINLQLGIKFTPILTKNVEFGLKPKK